MDNCTLVKWTENVSGDWEHRNWICCPAANKTKHERQFRENILSTFFRELLKQGKEGKNRCTCNLWQNYQFLQGLFFSSSV